MNRLLLAAGLAASLAAPLQAATSDWQESEGGRVRLVTSAEPGPDGRMRGALEIELKPGWKTYWRDPGESGVPPSVDLSRNAGLGPVEIGFPAPQRFDDGYSIWAGYGHTIALALSFPAEAPIAGAVEADIFLGICETICIPVSASLTAHEGALDPLTEAAIVEAAFSAVPPPASDEFGVAGWRIEGDRLVVDAVAPDGAAEDFFIASDGGYVFDTPRRIEAAGGIGFEVALIGRPKEDAGADIAYTLTGRTGAVSGTLRLP